MHVEDLGFRVWSLGFMVWVLGFRVQGLVFGVSGLGFRVQEFRDEGLGLSVQDSERARITRKCGLRSNTVLWFVLQL